MDKQNKIKKPLKLFVINEKSHCIAPDFELETEAVDKTTAFKHFRSFKQLAEYDDGQIKKLIKEI